MSHNGHYLPYCGQKIIRNPESVAVRQIDLPSQLFLKPAFCQIYVHTFLTKSRPLVSAGTIRRSIHFVYDQASLNILTVKSTRPDYWGVIVALALRKTAPASSHLDSEGKRLL